MLPRVVRPPPVRGARAVLSHDLACGRQRYLPSSPNHAQARRRRLRAPPGQARSRGVTLVRGVIAAGGPMRRTAMAVTSYGACACRQCGRRVRAGHRRPELARTRPGRQAAAARGAAGTKTVDYGGYTIDVPAGWPVYRLAAQPWRCVRYDRHAVYLGRPGPDQQCPAHLVGRTDAVRIDGRVIRMPAPRVTYQRRRRRDQPGERPVRAASRDRARRGRP